MTPADVLAHLRDQPVFAAPYAESRALASRLLVRYAVIAGAFGFMAATAGALRQRDWETGFVVAGVITVMLLAPLATTAAMAALLRRRFARVADSRQHDELRIIPGVPTPLLPFYAIAVQQPMKLACIRVPFVAAGAFLCLNLLGALSWRSGFDLRSLIPGFLVPSVGLAVVGLAYVPMLFFSGPLEHAIQVIGRHGCTPATWDASWDDEWERATRLTLIGDKILRTDVRVLAVAIPAVAILGALGISLLMWLIGRFPGREAHIIVCSVGAVFALVGFLLALARRLSMQS